ncbi:hypothetical protein [Geodermatophilus obscurus]|uniref:hypothetical protein n=1 Tax=Geodermatophilus obscurus TaxID=1861 RepID=UPI0002E8F734|nr:hypothetical protein [Geodermatophilus obscurus]
MSIGTWVGEFDKEQARLVLGGMDPFDEVLMIDTEDRPSRLRARRPESPSRSSTPPARWGIARDPDDPRSAATW